MRLTFLSHFIICLACSAAAFFAWRAGVFAAIWANDQSMMTSAIGALFVGTSMWLGRQAWLADSMGAALKFPDGIEASQCPDASFGHFAQRVLPGIGLFGTAIGLSLQGKALAAGGGAAFLPLATSLYCTAAGVLGFVVVAAMTHSLELGIKRAGR